MVLVVAYIMNIIIVLKKWKNFDSAFDIILASLVMLTFEVFVLVPLAALGIVVACLPVCISLNGKELVKSFVRFLERNLNKSIIMVSHWRRGMLVVPRGQMDPQVGNVSDITSQV